GRREVERPREHDGLRSAQLASHLRDVNAFVARLVALEPAQGLLELARGADSVAAAGLVPRDGDVDEPLIEVPLRLGSGSPGELELLVCLEESSCAEMLEPGLVRVSHAF